MPGGIEGDCSDANQIDGGRRRLRVFKPKVRKLTQIPSVEAAGAGLTGSFGLVKEGAVLTTNIQ